MKNSVGKGKLAVKAERQSSGRSGAVEQPAQNTILEEKLFSDKTITVNGKVFQVPCCEVCGKELSPAYDSKRKCKTGYIWKGNCSHYPPGVRLGFLGSGKTKTTENVISKKHEYKSVSPTDAEYAILDIHTFLRLNDAYGPFNYEAVRELRNGEELHRCARLMHKVEEKKMPVSPKAKKPLWCEYCSLKCIATGCECLCHERR